MIHLLKKILGGKTPQTEDVLERGGDETQRTRRATCAILIEMAKIDGEFTEAEREHILQALKKGTRLSDGEVLEIMGEAERELQGSIDLWKFTHSINRNFSMEEKEKIIEMVWELVYADGHLEKHEDYLIHKLATLLNLSHKQLIQAKLKVKDRH